ncbi:MAG: hypothetical protein COW65_03805 [Cytophagales bacterium CG18_big_fil_WC_8_21_14_2_50_42_9]|nr:MAG: hypothetical protein COW65_03805 [Cytophagales bacterium CG18_big_fil_WC_8_21_14_2_50_42_9]
MKKFIVMLALGLSITRTTFAQNNSDASKKNTDNRYEQTDWNRGRNDQVDNRKDQEDYNAPQKIASRDSDDFSRKYNLNNSQKQKMQVHNLKWEREKQNWQKHYGNSYASNQKFEKQMQDKREKEIRTILNAKQYEQYRGHHS